MERPVPSSQLKAVEPLHAAEFWPQIAHTVTHAGIDPIQVHEQLLSNKVEVLLNHSPRCWFVVTKSLLPILPTWKAMHVLGGWAEDKLNRDDCMQLHKDLVLYAQQEEQEYLFYNDHSFFLIQLLERVQPGGILWRLNR